MFLGAHNSLDGFLLCDNGLETLNPISDCHTPFPYVQAEWGMGKALPWVGPSEGWNKGQDTFFRCPMPTA